MYEYSLPSGTEMARARVGAHPTDLVLSNRKIPDEQSTWQYRLFVAAANTNDVFVLGVSEGKELNVLETLNAGFSALAPAGMTPSGLALSADQTRLYIACSDVNALAVADISETRSRVAGFVPTGAYPTAVRVVNGGRLAVLNGHSGSMSVIDAPTDEMLPDYTSKAMAATPYRESFSDSLPEQRSSIEHVIYILMDGAASGSEHRQARARVRAAGEFPSGRRYACGRAQLGRRGHRSGFYGETRSELRGGTPALQRFRRRRACQPASRGLSVEQRVVGGLDGAQLRAVRR